MSDTLKFKVVGERKMNCGGCERSVTATLAQLPGVEQVKADHTTQGIEVLAAPGQVSSETIKSELGEIGYQVETA